MALKPRLLAIALLCVAEPVVADCAPRDFMTIDLPQGGDPLAVAIGIAFPGSDADIEAGVLTLADGTAVALAPARDVGGAARLTDATIGDMFTQGYPLTFDLTRRDTAWEDPGRARNDAFFRALYGDSAEAVRSGLTTVRIDSAGLRADFTVTRRHCVDVQLAAALAAVAALDPVPVDWFREVGGGFNWRVIAGTERLSAHSFGAAIDLNASLGGYWRWSGEAEGAVGPFQTTIPPELVAAFERFGFIWGGKWHHYDGMHFEYRPDLILYARLTMR